MSLLGTSSSLLPSKGLLLCWDVSFDRAAAAVLLRPNNLPYHALVNSEWGSLTESFAMSDENCLVAALTKG